MHSTQHQYHMNPSEDLDDRHSFPIELTYAILDQFISNEPRLREIAPEDVLTFHPNVEQLLTLMCLSASRLHSFHERLQENPSLASCVKRFRMEQKDAVDQWFGDPVLPSVLNIITSTGLDSLVIRGPQTGNAVHQTRLPLSLDRALISVTSHPGNLKHLHFFRISISDRLFGELGSEIDFLELNRVVSHRNGSSVDTLESHMAQALRFQPRTKPLQVTTLSLARAGSDSMWSMLRGNLENQESGLPHLRKLVITKQILSRTDKQKVDAVKSEAPNLHSLRFIAYHSKCLGQFSDINELCGSGPFQHLEIVQRYVDMHQHTVPDSTVIGFLSKATQHLGLETLTIAVTANFAAATLHEWVAGEPEFREKKSELYQVLDHPFFAMLRRVVLDFTDISFHYSEIFSRMLPRIQDLFPEEMLEGSHVKFSLEHRF